MRPANRIRKARLAVFAATVALIAGSTLDAARRAAATRPVEALRT